MKKVGAVIIIIPVGQLAAQPVKRDPESGIIGVNPAPVPDMAQRGKFKIGAVLDFEAGFPQHFLE